MFVAPRVGESKGESFLEEEEDGSVENLRRRPVTACDTVEGMAQDEERDVGVLVPVPDDVFSG